MVAEFNNLMQSVLTHTHTKKIELYILKVKVRNGQELVPNSQAKTRVVKTTSGTDTKRTNRKVTNQSMNPHKRLPCYVWQGY